MNNTANRLLLTTLSILYLLIQASAIPYHAQNVFLGKGVNQYTAIAQDKKGLIWLGTDRGLFYYDGYQLHSVIQNRYINKILILDDQRICFCDFSGLHIFNYQTEKTVPLSLEKHDFGNVRNAIINKGHIWATTENDRLICYNLAKDKISIHKVGIGQYYAIAYVNGNIYLGGSNGLGCYNIKNKVYRKIEFSKTNPMVNSLLWDDKRKCMWIGTITDKLYKYHNSISEAVQTKSTSFKCLTFDIDHHLLIGSDNGLLEYNPEERSMVWRQHDERDPQSICNNIIWSIFRDRADNIWLGTDHGISLLHYTPDYRQITLYSMTNLSIGNRITCIFRDSNGRYWYGGLNGIIRQDNNGKTIWYRVENSQFPITHNRVRKIYEDKEHDIWICTDDGILHLDKRTGQFIHHKIIDKTGKYNTEWAYDIAEDKYGRLWIMAYSGGLFVVDKDKIMKWNSSTPYIGKRACDVLKGNNTYIEKRGWNIAEDNHHALWVNCGNELSRIDTKTLTVKTIFVRDNKGMLLKNSIDNMIYDGSGFIWYTSEEHFVRINTTTLRAYLPHIDFMTNDKVLSMTYRNHKIWMTLTDRVMILNTLTFKSIELNLPSSDYSAIYHDRHSDKIILGGNDLLLEVSPTILHSNNVKHPALLISVLSNNRRLVQDKDFYIRDGITLFPSSTLELTLEISDLSYSGRNTLNYEYKLEGNNDAWIRLGTGDNRISFLNLSPGTYTLKIRSGYDDNTTSVYHFRITPPWYMSTFAYTAYTLLILFILIIIIKYFLDKNKREYKRMEREKSLELSNMKIDFFTNMSHELKTPLSLILAPISIMLSEIKEPKTKEYLDIINKNALRLNTLIQSILNFKRIEYKEESMVIRTKQELGAMIASALNMFKPVCEKKHISIEFNRCESMIWMNLDVVKMESVLYNLISNAIKFVSEDNGKVTIVLNYDQASNNAYITIKDNGEGIPKNEINMIWTRLYQGSNKKHNPNGTGIGLYLVKKFVELHNGTITIKSEVKKGTSFIIAIPNDDKNRIKEAGLPIQMQDEENENFHENDNRSLLLFVDDNEEILSFMSQTFSTSYRCVTANNGEKGLKSALEYKPDLMIIDEMMPVMNGMTLCRKLRKEMPTTSIPVIMLTAKDDNNTEIESIKSGVDAFMPKPFDINRLRLRIEQLLESRRLMQSKWQMEKSIDMATSISGNILNDDEKLMNDIIKTLEERMSDSSFNVTMLCEELGVGTKRVLRLIKTQTGMTPVNFMRIIRMKKAAVLLRQNKFTVSEVMYMVGFQNTSYFSKCFTTEFGISPKEYMEKETETDK